MKTVSLNRVSAVNGSVKNIIARMAAYRVHLVALSALGALAGEIFGSDPILYFSAITGLVAAYPDCLQSDMKGGKK